MIVLCYFICCCLDKNSFLVSKHDVRVSIQWMLSRNRIKIWVFIDLLVRWNAYSEFRGQRLRVFLWPWHFDCSGVYKEGNVIELSIGALNSRHWHIGIHSDLAAVLPLLPNDVVRCQLLQCFEFSYVFMGIAAIVWSKTDVFVVWCFLRRMLW
jgi:hypothetical protein